MTEIAICDIFRPGRLFVTVWLKQTRPMNIFLPPTLFFSTDGSRLFHRSTDGA